MTTINLTPAELPKLLAAHEKLLPKAVMDGCRMAAERGRSYLVKVSPTDQGMYRNSWRTRTVAGIYPEIINDSPHAGIIELGARPHGVNRAGMEALIEWCKRHLSGMAQATKAMSKRAAKRAAGNLWTLPKDPYKKPLAYGPKAPKGIYGDVYGPRERRGRKHGPTAPRMFGPKAPKGHRKVLAGAALDKEAKAFAWAIAAKLKKYGQPGKFIVRDSMPMLVQFLRAEVARSVKKTLDRKSGT